jgi:hypothetical protein
MDIPPTRERPLFPTVRLKPTDPKRPVCAIIRRLTSIACQGFLDESRAFAERRELMRLSYLKALIAERVQEIVTVP